MRAVRSQRRERERSNIYRTSHAGRSCFSHKQRLWPANTQSLFNLGTVPHMTSSRVCTLWALACNSSGYQSHGLPECEHEEKAREPSNVVLGAGRALATPQRAWGRWWLDGAKSRRPLIVYVYYPPARDPGATARGWACVARVGRCRAVLSLSRGARTRRSSVVARPALVPTRSCLVCSLVCVCGIFWALWHMCILIDVYQVHVPD